MLKKYRTLNAALDISQELIRQGFSVKIHTNQGHKILVEKKKKKLILHQLPNSKSIKKI